MNQLTKRIQENKRANRFSTLEEENLDQETPAPAPKLLDAKRIKELITAHKQKNVPTLADIKKVQEYVTQNAHTFDEATRKEIMELCKPKSKPAVKQSGDAHASQSKTRPTGEQMGNALKKQIQTMNEDTKIRMLNALIPDTGWNINRIKRLAEVFGLDSAFVNKSNSVQIGFTLISYKKETTEISLLDTGATENFIDAETVKRLRLGTKELPYKRPVYNVDGTLNRQGYITHHCDLMVSKGNVRRSLRFFITNLGRDRFIFSYPWFKTFNTDINWEDGMLRGPKVKVETMRKVTWDKVQGYLKEKQMRQQNSDLTMDIHEAIIKELEDQADIWIGRNTMEVNRTHNATEMAHKYAEQHKKEEITLPEEFKRHAALFSDKEAKKFPPSRPCDHKIELIAEAPDKFNCKTYPMSLKDQEAENQFLDENLEKGYIVPSESPYGFGTFMVPKKDSKEKRYIINYRPLNTVTRKDVTPLPNLAQCIEDLQGMELFSKFNIRWGYNNIRIREGDEWKAAFKTRHGLFEPKVMFFGMSNSPPTFQRFMNLMLEELYQHFEKKGIHNIRKMFKSYMDNCGLGTLLKDSKLHVEILHYAFNLLAKNGLHLKLSKSIFMQPTMDFLGVHINKDGATIDPAKVARIIDWPENITTLKGARSFIGVMGYHRMFIAGFSSITALITQLFGKDIPFEWSPACITAVRELKKCITQAPVLVRPDPSKQFKLEVDASQIATGAILYQRGQPI